MGKEITDMDKGTKIELIKNDIETLYLKGKTSLKDIASKYTVPVSWVNKYQREIVERLLSKGKDKKEASFKDEVSLSDLENGECFIPSEYESMFYSDQFYKVIKKQHGKVLAEMVSSLNKTVGAHSTSFDCNIKVIRRINNDNEKREA